MGRKNRILAAILVLVLLLSACTGGGKSAWQEQYDLGMRYLENGDYEEAILAFSAAIDIDDSRPEAYLGRAQAYEATGELEKALKDFKKAKKAAINSDEDYDDLIEELERYIEAVEQWMEETSFDITVIDAAWEFFPGSEDGNPDRCFHIPQLILEYDLAWEANNVIWDELVGYLSGQVYQPDAGGDGYVTYNAMTYVWQLEGEIVTILVVAEAQNPAWTEYYVYNISTVTGTLLSDEEFLAGFGMDEDRFRELAGIVLETYGLPVEGMNRLTPYIGADGHLCMAAEASEPGNNGQYLHLFDLTAGTPLETPVCTIGDHFYVEGNLREEEVVYEGYIFSNSVAYRAWIDQKGKELGISGWNSYGIRFDSPVTVNFYGIADTLQEASLGYTGEAESLDTLLSNLDPDPETGFLVRVRVTGSFWLEENYNEQGYSVQEINGWVDHCLCPNGKYHFSVESFEIVE